MKQLLIQDNRSIKDALKKLSEMGEKCLVVINSKKKYLGTLSDGDVRRTILNGKKLGDSIKSIFNNNCFILFIFVLEFY